jgi:hypothetical protein
MEACFKGIAVLNVKLPPKNYACCLLLRALKVEFAREISKLVGLF